MTNFLRALAQRTIAPAREGQLQPRLSSRFESSPLPVGRPAAVQANGPTDIDPTRPTHLTVHPEDPAFTTNSIAPDNSASPARAANVNPGALTSEPSSTTSPLPSLLGNAHVLAGQNLKPASTDPVPSLVEHRSATTQFKSTLLIEPVTAQPPTFTPASPVSAAAPATASDEETGATRLRPRPGSTKPPPMAAVAAAASSTPVAAPLPAAPTIRVHIGRVDIRAIHSAEAPVPRPIPPPRRPLLPLDVYLERRDSK